MKNLSVVDGVIKGQDRHKPSVIDAVFERRKGGFQSIGEFVAAASSRPMSTKYWRPVFLQDFSDDPQRKLSGREINEELKHLGYGVKNITDCINSLKSRSPQHMIQTKKNSSAKQAWKEYRVTRAGIDHIYQMIHKGGSDAEA